MVHDVFISYSTKDQNDADAVRHGLESQGILCWIASRDIPSGKDYAEAILEAIAVSKVMVVVFSTHSNLSVHVMREVERAISYNATIIPFRIDNVIPTKSMEYYLSTVQWLNAISPPVQNHLNNLCDRVRQIIGDRKDITREVTDIIISAKHRKALDLAYDMEECKNPNPYHAAFWLGSRYLPGFAVFEITRKRIPEERQIVDEALFSEFEKHEKQLGFDIRFDHFFQVLTNEPNPNKKNNLRQNFIHRIIDVIGANHGSKASTIWMVGYLLSELWFWTEEGKRRNANDILRYKIDKTFNSLNGILAMLDIPATLKHDFNELHRDSDKFDNLKILQDWSIGWTVQIEMYLQAGEYEISPDNAEIFLELNPHLSTFVLQQCLKRNPDDFRSNILIGKACLKIISDGPGLDPLLRTDPGKILIESLQRIIELQPDSDWSKRARIYLEKIKQN